MKIMKKRRRYNFFDDENTSLKMTDLMINVYARVLIIMIRHKNIGK